MARISIKVGAIDVEYEGTDAFIEKKLLKLVRQFAELAEDAPPSVSDAGKKDGGDAKAGPLASFLTSKKAKGSQNQRRCFLATAEWLRLKGTAQPTTGDVTKALRGANQKKLTNASDCLNSLVRQGFCEKDGKGFYVTHEGKESLG